MSGDSLAKFWPLMQSLIRDFLEIMEPHIEEAAIRQGVPIELYYYSELGLDSFSTAGFQKRDPFSNPQLFERMFVTLSFKGWIEPGPDGSYEVTEQARRAASEILYAGIEQILPLEASASMDLHRLARLLKQIVLSNAAAPEPPEKWAITRRFRLAGKDSPPIVKIREYLMDLLAYRDDCHLAASHPYFGRAGILWSVLGALCQEEQLTASGLTDSHSYRGYEDGEYEVALAAAAQIGWAEKTGAPGHYRITIEGRRVHDEAGQLTDQYFYRPWSALDEGELDELYDLLGKLREQVRAFRRTKRPV